MTTNGSSNAIRQPVLFVSHGAPIFALQPGVAGAQLSAFGLVLKKPNAVLVISPHWRSHNLRIAHTAQPKTIHDFGGFPEALYHLKYPAPGAPEWAERTAKLLRVAGYEVQLDEDQGLDHGAWVPLRYLFPKANIPVFQLSMPYDLNCKSSLALGHSLSCLANEGILIVGSGSLTHNLYEFQMNEPAQGQSCSFQPVSAYINEFVKWVRNHVINGNHDQLVHTLENAPHGKRAHPSPEHFLPLLVAVGAAGKEASVTVLDGGVTHEVLSMESYVFGLPLVR